MIQHQTRAAHVNRPAHRDGSTTHQPREVLPTTARKASVAAAHTTPATPKKVDGFLILLYLLLAAGFMAVGLIAYVAFTPSVVP